MSRIINSIRQLFVRVNIKNILQTFYYDCFKMPIRLMIYPIQGFDDFKREKQSKSYVSWFYLGMLILTQVIAFNANGFLLNKNDPNDFSILLIFALTVFPVFVFVVANWATTALMDGKGTMIEIFRSITYAFFPYVWLGLLATLISNFITLDEVIFFTFIQSLGIILAAYMLFFGMLGIHEYGLLKTIFMFVFTLVAIAVILFIILLFFSLFQQVWAFFKSIYDEFVMRFMIWTL